MQLNKCVRNRERERKNRAANQMDSQEQLLPLDGTKFLSLQ